MDSPQSVVSPFKSSVMGDSEKQKSGPLLSKDIELNGKEVTMRNLEDSVGVLDVYIHQARDIQNICIYHKQDVYAKICLTSNPDNAVSTKTINGGGRNPVFNENLRLNVNTVDSSLKCEIWMLSRVKNYLEDQLLGIALVPLSEVLVMNGRTLEKEFSLSSTDLFHSPSGFVQLSLAYTGASPDVMVIPHSVSTGAAAAGDTVALDPETTESLAKDLDKIEFPDPKIVNEDHIMVSEYFGISCDETQCSDSDHQSSDDAGVQLVESFSACSVESAQQTSINKVDSPPSIVSTNGVSSPSLQASSESSDAAVASKSPTQEQVPNAKQDKRVVAEVRDGGMAESDSSSKVVPNKEDGSLTKPPVVSVNIEPEPMVVQQDIVDMYMKSMQQFTESLAKMKLPDIDIGSPSSGNSSSDKKLESPASAKSNNNSRVFYGSRAFF